MGSERHSPITFAAKVTTPLLIQHGENDRRVPIMQAHKFYKALKKMGTTRDRSCGGREVAVSTNAQWASLKRMWLAGLIGLVVAGPALAQTTT